MGLLLDVQFQKSLGCDFNGELQLLPKKNLVNVNRLFVYNIWTNVFVIGNQNGAIPKVRKSSTREWFSGNPKMELNWFCIIVSINRT